MTSLRRVILDTNVVLRWVLGARDSGSPIETIFLLAVERRLIVLLPLELLQEVREKLLTKRYCAERFTAQDADELIAYLSSIGHVMAPLTGDFPVITRDRKDDYLIAAAVIGNADYLVSGDKHLLELGDALAPLKIRSPRAFVEEFMADDAGRRD